MKTLKLFAVAAVALLAVACGNSNATTEKVVEKNPLAGAWINADSVGFVLTNCGKAKTINIDSLILEAYKVDSTGLTLVGKVVSNGDTTQFAETYTVAPDSTNLILIKDGSIAWCLSRPNAKCSDGNCTHDHSADKAHKHNHEGCTGEHNHEGCTGNHNHGAEKHEGCTGEHNHEGCSGNHNHGTEKHEGCTGNHEGCSKK